MTRLDDLILTLACAVNFPVEFEDLKVDAAPVRWFSDDEIQAPSLRDSVAAIAAGRFDV